MSTAETTSDPASIRLLGGPTVLIEYGGLRLLTDPTFSPAGEYPMGPLTLTKTADAPVAPSELGQIDAVLLSHDEHPDNLDNAGRAFLPQVPQVLTTTSGAQRLGQNTRGLAPGESVELPRPNGDVATVTATPALHGPDGQDVETVTGEVIGFVLTAEDLPTVYISGDNASLEVVREVARRFPDIDTAVLFAGAVRMSEIFDGELLTLDGTRAAEAATILDARRVVPAHVDSWGHFTEGREELVAVFESAGLADRLHLG